MNCCKHVRTNGHGSNNYCGSYALNEHPESGLCDRCYQELRADEAEARLAEYKQGFDRYEKVRKLRVSEYKALWDRCLWDGLAFDDLVDELP